MPVDLLTICYCGVHAKITCTFFNRLRAELGRCKEETLEDYCAELQELQQKLWQKNIRIKVSPGSYLKPRPHINVKPAHLV